MTGLTAIFDPRISVYLGACILVGLLIDYLRLRWKLRNANIIPRSTIIELVDALLWTRSELSSIHGQEAPRSNSYDAIQRLKALYDELERGVHPLQASLRSTEMLVFHKEMQESLRGIIDGFEKRYNIVDQASQRYERSCNEWAKTLLAQHDLLQYSSRSSGWLTEAETVLADHDAELLEEVEGFEAVLMADCARVYPALLETKDNTEDGVNMLITKRDFDEIEELFESTLLMASWYHTLNRLEAEVAISTAEGGLKVLLERNLALQAQGCQVKEVNCSRNQILEIHEGILQGGIRDIGQSHMSFKNTMNQHFGRVRQAIDRMTLRHGRWASIAQRINMPENDVWSEHGKVALHQFVRTRTIIMKSCEKEGLRYHEESEQDDQSSRDETRPGEATPINEEELLRHLKKLKTELSALRGEVPEGLRAYEENIIVTQIESIYEKLHLGEVPYELRRGYRPAGSCGGRDEWNLREECWWPAYRNTDEMREKGPTRKRPKNPS